MHIIDANGLNIFEGGDESVSDPFKGYLNLVLIKISYRLEEVKKC